MSHNDREVFRTMILSIKQQIKTLSAEQRICKDQRKTDHFKLPRIMTPSEANSSHGENRDKLRHIFHGYTLLRGKEAPEYKTAWISEKLVEKIMNEHKDNAIKVNQVGLEAA